MELKSKSVTSIPIPELIIILGYLVIGLGIGLWNWQVVLAGVFYIIIGVWSRPTKLEEPVNQVSKK